MSLLLDALRRAGNRGSGGDVAPRRETAATAARSDTARAVFTSTEGERRARARRLAGMLVGVILLAAAGAGAGWYYWLGLRADLDRDLAAYNPGSADDLAEQPAAEALPVDGGDGGVGEDAAEAGGQSATEAAQAATVEAGDDAPAGVGDTAVGAAAPAAAETGDAPESAAAAEASATEGAAATPVSAPADEVAAASGTAAGDAGEAEPADSAPAASAAADDSDQGDAGSAADAEASGANGAGQAAAESRRATPMVQASTGPSRLDTLLADGYAALQRGDLDAAGRAYREALARAPENHDALLGAAAIAQRRGDLATARTRYARILADEPRHPHALAGLLSIDGVSDPRRSESELKLLLRDHPAADGLHFALGNLYAAESRWGEAQQAFFDASREAPGNANYAFNLAVALDHLGQRAAAREHYDRALRLAGQSGSAFDPAAARRRLEQLR